MTDRVEPKDMHDPILAAIEEAETVVDPLDGLVKKVVDDPGAPFSPEVLERLTDLKRHDRSAFETLRADLKKSGCRVTALDEVMGELDGPGGRGPSQADMLIQFADNAELFHTPSKNAFADIVVNGHRETWLVRSKGFRSWLIRCYYQETGGGVGTEAMQSAINAIEARALFDGPERNVFLRVGECNGHLYLDLCDEDWRAVEITSSGWQVIDNPPVRFRRTTGMKPLSCPEKGGSIAALRRFLNVQSDADFVLVVSWALAALRPRGPYPVIVLSGEQGSAKSTFSSVLRALIDPNAAPLRALPREDRDLFIAANNAHVLAFDNVSGLPTWISDTLCRLATGGGFAVRQLHTDQDEVLFDAVRPAILNGIEDFVTRSDLADRAVLLTLAPIPEEERRPAQELETAFHAERPRILGVLLDAVVAGLAELPHTQLERLPRMADFALWATACETALWPPGTFSSAYSGNRSDAVEGIIEADPVAAATRTLMRNQPQWTGTATELLDALRQQVDMRVATSKTWPSSPQTLSGRLRRAATVLRKTGIDIRYDRVGRGRTRIIHIAATATLQTPDNTGEAASAPSAESGETHDGNSINGFDDHPLQTLGGDTDGRVIGYSMTVRNTPQQQGLKTAADGADDGFGGFSDPSSGGAA